MFCGGINSFAVSGGSRYYSDWTTRIEILEASLFTRDLIFQLCVPGVNINMGHRDDTNYRGHYGITEGRYILKRRCPLQIQLMMPLSRLKYPIFVKYAATLSKVPYQSLVLTL